MEELKKIEIEHRYQNMKSLLQEVRTIDKLAIITIGGMWSWIFSKEMTSFSHFHLLPSLILIFYYGKTLLLFRSYKQEKIKYKKPLHQEYEASENNKNLINTYIYSCFLLVNISYSIYLYFILAKI